MNRRRGIAALCALALLWPLLPGCRRAPSPAATPTQSPAAVPTAAKTPEQATPKEFLLAARRIYPHEAMAVLQAHFGPRLFGRVLLLRDEPDVLLVPARAFCTTVSSSDAGAKLFATWHYDTRTISINGVDAGRVRLLHQTGYIAARPPRAFWGFPIEKADAETVIIG